MDLSDEEKYSENIQIGQLEESDQDEIEYDQSEHNEEFEKEVQEEYEKMPNLNNEETKESLKLLNEYQKQMREFLGNLKYYSLICDKQQIPNGGTKVATSFVLSKYFDEILIISQINYIPSRSIFEVFFVLSRFDGEPIMIEEKYLRLLMARYLARLNTSIKFGCFSIDPAIGIIKLKMTSFIDKNQTISSLQLINFLTFMTQTSHFAISYHIYRILHMINKLSTRNMQYLSQKLQDQCRGILVESQKHLSHIFDILQNKLSQEYKPEENLIFNEYLDYPSQNVVENEKKIISLIEITSTKNEYFQTIILLELKINQQKKTSNIPDHHLIFIKLVQVRVIFNYYLSQEFKFQGGNLQSRYLLVKKQKANQSRSIREKQILNHLSQYTKSNGECVFIQKYYESNLNDFKQYLFMDLCINGTLEQFRTKFNETQSLNTKLFILYQICMAIRYMKDNNVYHSNLKPDNILLTKYYVIKIIEFEDSYCNQVNDDANDNPTNSLPFTAPELGDKCDQSKVDVFSFGMLMSEYIFGEIPIDFLKTDLSIIQKQYKDKNYQIKLNESYIKKLGPKHLMKSLYLLILSCLQPVPESRPKLEWIIVILREALCYIERMF